MKKADKKLLDDSLSKALAPRRPRQDLDAILGEYDDDKGIPESIPTGIPASVPATIPAGIPEPPKRKAEPETFAYLDATHTAAEKNVYNLMYRETLAKGQPERHFGPAEIRRKLGIGSRNTVHKALYGLIEKLSIEKVSEAAGNPAGPRYRVYHWKEIERRRAEAGMKIDPQTKQITAGIPRGIPAGIPGATPNNWEGGIPETGIPGIPEVGRVINREEVLSSQRANDDDERVPRPLAFVERELTGKNTSAEKWAEVWEVLETELKIAAGRTTVSSVPAFLAEHLRRRLFKKDKRQLEQESSVQGDSANVAAMTGDISNCPSCFGTGYHYPEGFERGVARCEHKKLRETGK